jgi:acetyl esterase/lipase
VPLAPAVHRYGPHPDQFLELTLPEAAGPRPVAVVLHGGFWRADYGIDLARPLARSLADDGVAAVAVEYRRVGAGGGWPETLDDVAAAVDALPDLAEAARLDLARGITVVGHSAGGHLAAWTAGRHRLPAGVPGAEPRVRVAAAVLQSAVLDLELAAEQRLGGDAVAALLGGTPAEVPDRYAVASPVRLLPTGAAVLCVHAAADDDVPLSQTERYAAAAAVAGDAVEVRVVRGDHMHLIDPAGDPWHLVRTWMPSGPDGGASGLTLSP